MTNPNYRHSFRFNYLYIVFRPFGNGRLPLFSIPHLVEHDHLEFVLSLLRSFSHALARCWTFSSFSGPMLLY